MLDYNITYREKDGGLQVIVSYKDSNGKWRQKSKQGFENNKKGEKVARNWADDTISNLKKIPTVNRQYEDITLIEFFRLFISDRSTTLRASTLKGYEDSIKHFKSLYNVKLKDINTMDIQREINKLDYLSTESILAYLKKLKCIFNFAVNKYEIISTNCNNKLN